MLTPPVPLTEHTLHTKSKLILLAYLLVLGPYNMASEKKVKVLNQMRYKRLALMGLIIQQLLFQNEMVSQDS